jgi:FkbM family methyltransferase
MKLPESMDELKRQAADLAPDSHGQLCQDIFVLGVLEHLTGGFFVEFGAANGVEFSNTYLLEKRFGWTGILAEPAQCWHPHLAKHRSALIDPRCVWPVTGLKLDFCQPRDANLASLTSFQKNTDLSTPPKFYAVETVSLSDLLKHRTPHTIDYLSMDTEGCEPEILEGFDFSEHVFKVITCEHNHILNNRNRIHKVLAENGYVRVSEKLSDFDDWYLHQSLLSL